MTIVLNKKSPDFLAVSTTLAEEFAKTAVLRDIKGGTPIDELEQLRESGLLNLVFPREYGGFGENWPNALKVVREISKADGSVGQLLGYHYVNTAITRMFGTAKQYAYYSSESVRHNWFWADAANLRDPDLILTPDGENFRLNGLKNFATGAKSSDVIVISGRRQDLGNLVLAIIPTQREGIQINDDWDHIGQRQTDSGSVAFSNVLVFRDEILGNSESNDPPKLFTTLFTPVVQLVFVNLYLGIALGAFAQAKKYTLTKTQPWILSPAQTAAQDPYIIEQYGNLWIDLATTISHTDHVASVLQTAWEKGEHLTATERGEVAVSVATAKVLSTRVALDVTSKIFEVTGARSAAKKYGFDRYWRNIRTHTLHDPVAYKVHEVGNWVLNKEMPPFTFYT